MMTPPTQPQSPKLTETELQIKVQWTQKMLQYFTDMSNNIVRAQNLMVSSHGSMFEKMMEMSKDYENMILEVSKIQTAAAEAKKVAA